MELHTFVGSPNSRKVEAVIDHLGLDVEIVHHDFAGGALRRSDYLAVNPNGMVPTLVDGSFILWESNAIMQYLADKAGNDTLFPRDLQRRTDVVRWQFWEQAHFNRAFGTLAFEAVAKPALNLAPCRPVAHCRARRRISSGLPQCSKVILPGAGIWLATKPRWRTIR